MSEAQPKKGTIAEKILEKIERGREDPHVAKIAVSPPSTKSVKPTKSDSQKRSSSQT